MLSPFVDVQAARLKIAENKMTTKMALERSLKAGNIDDAEMLSKYVQRNDESDAKLSALRQTYDKSDKDELVLNRQLQRELSKFPYNKDIEQELTRMTFVEKKNLFEELQIDNKLRNEMEGLKLNNEDNKNIESLSLGTKKKLLEELPKLADEYKRISIEEGLDGPDLQAVVNDAVKKLIAAMALQSSKPPISQNGLNIPMDMLLNSWYPILPASSQKNAWIQLQADHPDYVQTGLTKTMFLNWFQGRKAGSVSTPATPSTVAVTPSTPMKGGPNLLLNTPMPSGSSSILFSPAAPSSPLASQFPILSGPTMLPVAAAAPSKPAASKPATSKPATSKPTTSKPTTSKPATSKPPVPLAATTRSKAKTATSSSSSSVAPPLAASGPVLAGHGLQKAKVKIPFGNFLIDAKKLKHNVLSITNQAGQKVQGFGNVEISDNLKKVFTKQKVNTKKLVLSEAERVYIQKLLIKSDAEVSKSKQRVIGSPVAYMSDDVKELKDRLEVLVGELDANNDSPLIKDEIGQIMTRLIQKGKINREQAAEYMKAFIV